MRVEADKSVQHVAHESSRAACEEIMVNGRRVTAYGNSAGRERGVLPKGTGYVPGMRAGGSIAFPSVYDQSHLSECGRLAPAPIPFYLERRLECGVWITDTGWGKTYVNAKTGEVRGLTLAMARGLAAGHADSRVVIRDAWGRYRPEGEAAAEAAVTAAVVPKEQPAALEEVISRTKGKKGAAGMW